MLKLADLGAIASASRGGIGILAAADNTFATPYLQRPLRAGFDVVMHSGTKYLSGHSDVVNGVLVVGDNAELAERLAFLQNSVGAVAGPFDAFLALRGLKTLALRMQRHCENALELARLSRAPSEGGSACTIRAWPRIRSTRWRARRCAIRAARAPSAA